jgi:hypothetical protein
MGFGGQFARQQWRRADAALGRLGHFGGIGSMSGLLASGHGWAIYEYTS